MPDEEILKEFLFNSRYITIDVMNKYGLNINFYEKKNKRYIKKIKERLIELFDENSFHEVNDNEELCNLLGSDFHWVRSCL